MTFQDGEVVFYFDEERNRLLGPFTVYITIDGSVDLWYRSRPPITDGDDGDHVHAIVDGEIWTVGPFAPIDLKRLRRRLT